MLGRPTQAKGQIRGGKRGGGQTWLGPVWAPFYPLSSPPPRFVGAVVTLQASDDKPASATFRNKGF